SLPPVLGPNPASVEAPTLVTPIGVAAIHPPPTRADHLAAVGLGLLFGSVPALARALSQVPGAHDRPPYGTTERWPGDPMIFMVGDPFSCSIAPLHLNSHAGKVSSRRPGRLPGARPSGGGDQLGRSKLSHPGSIRRARIER